MFFGDALVMHSPWPDQLRQLATLDATQRVFGARGKNKGWGHSYRSELLSEAEVVDFEQWCGCKLPDSYREYLLTVGVGAGPFYGLMPLEKIKEELGYIYESYAELGQLEVGRPGDPFALEATLVNRVRAQVKCDAHFRCPPSPGGFIPICYQGCEFIILMVASGALAGRLFTATHFGEASGDWFPAGRPPGIIGYRKRFASLAGFAPWPDFATWVDGWLEQCFSDLHNDANSSGKPEVTREPRP